MEIEYDQGKEQQNLQRHGVSFKQVADFDFDTALYQMDLRKDYGELRWITLGLGQRVYNLVFTLRGPVIQVISFRKANKRETQRYVHETGKQDH